MFPGDHDEDIAAIHEIASNTAPVLPCRPTSPTEVVRRRAGHRHQGSRRGGVQLPGPVPGRASLKDKIHAVATKVYGADGVEYTAAADKQPANYTAQGFDNLPVCTPQHLSLSHDAKLKGAPPVGPFRCARLLVGAGFVYLICGDMCTMPASAPPRPPCRSTSTTTATSSTCPAPVLTPTPQRRGPTMALFKKNEVPEIVESDEARAHREHLTRTFTIEVIPMKSLDNARELPAGAPLSVTASPVKGLEEPSVSPRSSRRPEPVPHISARRCAIKPTARSSLTGCATTA